MSWQTLSSLGFRRRGFGQGGWISERGRLRDDPYIIAKATPAPRPRPSHLAADPLSSSSNWGRERVERPVRGIGVAGHSNSWQDPSSNPERTRTGDGNDGTKSSRGAAGSRQPPAASQHGHAVQPWTRSDHGQRQDPHRSRRQESGSHQAAGMAAGVSRRVQPAATSERGDATAKGSFGLVTSPSAEGLQTNDTGDKVKCPVCQRGMDHWKSGQRQQVIIKDITCGPVKPLGPTVPLWACYCR